MVTKTSARISRVRPSNPYRTVEARRHMSRCAGERLPPCAPLCFPCPTAPQRGWYSCRHGQSASEPTAALERAGGRAVLRHEPPAYTKDNSTQTQTPMTAECNCRHSQSAAILLPSRSSPGGRAHSFLGSKMRPPGARDPSWLTIQPTTHRVLGSTKPLALRPCGGFCFSGLPRSPSSIVRVDKPLLRYESIHSNSCPTPYHTVGSGH